MSSKCYLAGPQYSDFKNLYTGHKLETLNWLGEKGGVIISEHKKGSKFGEWAYPETEKFISEVLEGKHCIGVQKRADILKGLFTIFSSRNNGANSYEENFSKEYSFACRSRGILLSEFDFSNP